MSLPAILRVADLAQNTPTEFDLVLDAQQCKALAHDLGLFELRKTRLKGTIRASGKENWQLSANLGATVVQACVVTLDPVTTRLDVPLSRLFMVGLEDPDDPEVEMTLDESVEPLPSQIDLFALLSEGLALNLPPYPRREGAEVKDANFTEPGKVAMRDEDAKPFAGLAALRDQLQGDQEKE